MSKAQPNSREHTEPTEPVWEPVAQPSPIDFVDGEFNLFLTFGHSVQCGADSRRPEWKAWVSCDCVDLVKVLDAVTFSVQDAISPSSHTVKHPPFELSRTAIVQGSHQQTLEVSCSCHFKPWFKTQTVEQELHVRLPTAGKSGRGGGGRGRDSALSKSDDRMVVLRDPLHGRCVAPRVLRDPAHGPPPIAWALHEARPGSYVCRPQCAPAGTPFFSGSWSGGGGKVSGSLSGALLPPLANAAIISISKSRRSGQPGQ